MGNLLVSEKNIVDAEKEFKEMVRLDPATAPWLWNFYLSQKAYDKSFALFDEASKRILRTWVRPTSWAGHALFPVSGWLTEKPVFEISRVLAKGQ